jgi:hypothetical protein
VGILVLIPIEILVVMLLSLGMALTAKIQGNWWSDFVNGLTPLARLILIKPLQLSVKVARYISHSFGLNWDSLQSWGVAFFGALYQWANLAIGLALDWPLYLVKLQFWLLDVAIPDAIQAALRGIHGTVKVVTKTLPAIERTIVKLPKLSKAQAKALIGAAVATYIHPYLAQLRWLRAHFHALTVAIPRALPIPQAPTIPNIWKRLRALEKKLAVPIGIAAVATALARLGVGWLRCNNVRKVGRSMCGLDTNLLDSLLLDALAIFSVVSVVEFAKELQAIEGEAVGILGRLIREFPKA